MIVLHHEIAAYTESPEAAPDWAERAVFAALIRRLDDAIAALIERMARENQISGRQQQTPPAAGSGGRVRRLSTISGRRARSRRTVACS
jgi:hypothetical protein